MAVNMEAFNAVRAAKDALGKERDSLDRSLDRERIIEINRAIYELNEAEIRIVGDNPYPIV
jgi:hypothetical protein